MNMQLKETFHVPHLALLVDLFDDIVQQLAGPQVVQTVKRIRQLAVERRAGMPEAEQRLVAELDRLDASTVPDVIRAFTIYFDLANLAEDLNRVRTLRRRSRSFEPSEKRRTETIHDAIATLKQKGMSAGELQHHIDRLRIEPVFTAHPSEAKRRTTRLILRRLRHSLAQMTQPDTSEDERSRQLNRLRADLTAMWQSDLLRPRRPRVMSEVERGLFFANVLWSVIPQITRDVREALARNYPEYRFTLPPVLRFGTWIGGDRDGHPFVTVETTADTLDLLRKTALEGHLTQCRQLLEVVVISDRHTWGLETLKTAVQTAAEHPVISESLTEISESEIGRQWLKVIEQRLLATQQADSQIAYRSAESLESDILQLISALNASDSRDIMEMYVQPWLDTVRSLGFHFAAMDIRQHSGVHTAVIAELLKQAGIHDGYEEADDADRLACLLKTLDQPLELSGANFSDSTQETLALFRLLAERIDRDGIAAFGGYVISMTHHPSHVIAVLWLWRHVWRDVNGDKELPLLPIVPLFETIEDLEKSRSIMMSLWGIAEYNEYIRCAESQSQMVMIGYSDSTKDGGYLAASWQLHQAQSRLGALAEQHGVRLIVFHGRGGALGRGGGPAARAVLSLPPNAVQGAMRVTEQGEILAERYDDPEIAFRHLEQVTWATLLVSGDDSAGATPEYESAMNEMADLSLNAYRELVSHPSFLSYFELATPISEIERLPIGSRPARRGARRSLSDLRAIPWTFAWTQSRHLIPAWYGLGTAIRRFVDQQQGDWTQLREMYLEWRFFAAMIDNAEMGLAKADMEIAHRYRKLFPGEEAEEIWEMLRAEYERSRAAILLLKQQGELLERTAWLQRSIRARNPGVDPLNFLQIRLLREARASTDSTADDDQDETSIPHQVRLTINGIAAGLRTTG